ncbi:MAG: hypothetical protein AAGF56_04995 [Pseudomonadota bacterium]
MRFFPLMLAWLTACAEFPALDGTISDAARDAPYPTLTPIPVSPQQGVDVTADLQARSAALQARAARLRATQVGS